MAPRERWWQAQLHFVTARMLMPEQWAREGQRAGELHPRLWEEGREALAVVSSSGVEQLGVR